MRDALPQAPEDALDRAAVFVASKSTQELDRAVRELIVNQAPPRLSRSKADKEAASARTQSVLKARQHLQRVITVVADG